ncbi:hypothetical protein Dimus_010311 [Dionaea muscipula]
MLKIPDLPGEVEEEVVLVPDMAGDYGAEAPAQVPDGDECRGGWSVKLPCSAVMVWPVSKLNLPSDGAAWWLVLIRAIGVRGADRR